MSRKSLRERRAYAEDGSYGFTRSGTHYSPERSPQLSDGEDSDSSEKYARQRLAELEAQAAEDLANQPRDRKGKFQAYMNGSLEGNGVHGNGGRGYSPRNGEGSSLEDQYREIINRAKLNFNERELRNRSVNKSGYTSGETPIKGSRRGKDGRLLNSVEWLIIIILTLIVLLLSLSGE